MATKTIDQIKQDLSLSKLEGGKLDISQLIFRVNDRLNTGWGDLSQPEKYNTFIAGVRLLQSNLNSRIPENDGIYLNYLKEEAKDQYDINQKIDIQFKRLDLLHRIRDQSLGEVLYSTLESPGKPGALSKYIADRIAKKDSNFILGILGAPRSGKSSCGNLINHNVGKLTGVPFQVEDVVYTLDSLLARKQTRRQHKNLRGSGQQVDEGEAIDSQSWFETEVKEIVNHLRQQGADNTLTIIISPMFTDFANKSRGLFHAVLYPWKVWGNRYMELTDTGNIDYDKGVSSWKLDFLDTDPMSGKTYPGKLKAGLGDIIKIDCERPPKDLWSKYLTKSKKFKIKQQKNTLKRIRLRKLRAGDSEVIDDIKKQILAEIDTYKKGKDGKNINRTRIMRKFGIGRSYADQIVDSLNEKNEKQQERILAKNQMEEDRRGSADSEGSSTKQETKPDNVSG